MIKSVARWAGAGGNGDGWRPAAAHDPGDVEGAVIDGLSSVSVACGDLHERRLALGLGLDEVIDRCPCDPETIEWVDEGDVATPVEALAYFAAAVGLRLEVRVSPA
ncbi:MAG TPA: hypothetical protein VNY84_13530 [Acidimicrobiales bacterium]|nr:hypothetical protein [Acidimicrobiales bacterium]